MAGSSTEIPTAAELERILAQEAELGTLILTTTSRLARRVLHRVRESKLRARAGGWESPRVWGISSWTKRLWDGLWLPYRLLDRGASLRLWHEATRVAPPPDGITSGPSLFLQLQEALDALEMRGLESLAGDEEAELPSWRRRVTRTFLSSLDRNGFVTWHQLSSRVARELETGRVSLPQRVMVAAPELLDDRSRLVVEALATRATVEILTVRAQREVQGRVFATPEQEILAVTAELLEAWNDGARDLAVVPLDEGLFPSLRQALAELEKADGPCDRECQVRYNIARGGPLGQHPLTRTGLLPLSALAAPRPGPVLSSLLTSPYVDPPTADQMKRMGDSLWAVPTLRQAVALLGRWNLPTRALAELYSLSSAPLRQWLQILEQCWKELGFPRLEGPLRELDVLAHRHLAEALDALTRAAGEIEVRAHQLRTWIDAAATGTFVTEPSPENAGIQVLPPGEAAGLAFQQLWLVGAHGRALPSPPRELPLLSARERRAVAGGTSEEQWEAAQGLLQALLGSAPVVRSSRALGQGPDDPYLPSPLVRDEPSGDEAAVADPWCAPHPAWMRAPWRHQALLGISSPTPEPPAEQPLPEALPRMLAVGSLATLLACPFAGFASLVLGLRKLELPQRGLDPATRGRLVHEILHLFVSRIIRDGVSWSQDLERASRVLEDVVGKVLDADPGDPFLRAELQRLLGEERQSGLLSAWLAREAERAEQGWRYEGAEMRFTGLQVAGLELTGRVDRLDFHPRHGFLVWDYKTGGSLPTAKDVLERFRDPQLPAYLQALSRGLLQGVDRRSEPVQAGYIVVSSEAELKIQTLRASDWDGILRHWEESCSRRLVKPLAGSFPADPDPAPTNVFSRRNGACFNCPYYCLCGHFDEVPT